jgi:hypothetical protein
MAVEPSYFSREGFPWPIVVVMLPALLLDLIMILIFGYH